MIINKHSHADHGLTVDQLAYLADIFFHKMAFFTQTIQLPEHFGTVPCGLHGPIMGDPPIDLGHGTGTTMRKRPGRDWESRLCAIKPRRVSMVTVIGGPHENEACILYTAYGGPLAPREIADPALYDPNHGFLTPMVWYTRGRLITLDEFKAQRENLRDYGDTIDRKTALDTLDQRIAGIEESQTFWAEHALSDPETWGVELAQQWVP